MARKIQNNDMIKMTPDKAMRAVSLMIRNRFPFMLVGAPGVAKTAIVEQAVKMAEQKLVVFHPVISDPTDFKGMPAIMKLDVPKEAKDAGAETAFLAQFVPFDNLKRLLTATEPTVAFADDLGQAPPMVQAAWMQLVLARKLDDKIVSDNITFISASNRKEDKAGVQGILEPLKSRFVSIIELIPDHEQWLAWARKHGKIHPYVRAFVRQFGMGKLWEFNPSNDMTNSVCPRTVEHASKIMWAKPDADIRPMLLAGAVGGGWATEFEAFIKVVSRLPKMSAIKDHPDKAPVPPHDEASAQYAIVEAMLDNTKKDTIKPFLTYISRFKPEFQQWYVSQLKEINPVVLQTKAYADWAAKTGIK